MFATVSAKPSGWANCARRAQAGFLSGVAPPELGEIIAGRRGRTSDQEITICDLTGTGAQDTAIATHAMKAAKAAGTGMVITS
jgi:ornithine cyclodeaminase